MKVRVRASIELDVAERFEAPTRDGYRFQVQSLGTVPSMKDQMHAYGRRVLASGQVSTSSRSSVHDMIAVAGLPRSLRMALREAGILHLKLDETTVG
jgi:hypothetical protein